MRGAQIAGVIKNDVLRWFKKDSFWMIIGMTVFLTSFFIPPDGAPYLTVAFEGYRGVYNSAWVGTVAAVTVSWSLGLMGFFLINHSIQEDEQFRVGHLVEAAPISRGDYLWGKFLGSAAILTVVLFTSMLVAIILQLIRGESMQVQIFHYLVPYAVLAFPALVVVAGVAVLFEATEYLRGPAGNIVYFFLFSVSIVERIWEVSLGGMMLVLGDLFGSNIAIGMMKEGIAGLIPGYGGGASYGFITQPNPSQTVLFTGISWTVGVVLGRLGWILIAGLVVMVAARVFRGFDPDRAGRRIGRLQEKKRDRVQTRVPVSAGIEGVRYTPVAVLGAFSFLTGLLLEIRMMLKGLPRWWFGLSLLMIAGGFLLPLPNAHRYLLPLAWLWPIGILSQLGTREAEHNTGPLLRAAGVPIGKHILAMYGAGVLMTLVLAGGVAFRLLGQGNGAGFLALMAGALFVPALALFCGVSSRSRRIFEVLYFLLWYMGPLNGVWFLDYIGIHTAGPVVAYAYLLLTVVMLMGSVAARERYLDPLHG